MKTRMAVVLGCLLATAVAQAAAPVISNVRASQRAGTKLVDITYDIADADGDLQTIQVYVSADSGFSYRIPAVSFTGAVGANVAPGVNKKIVWDAGHDWNGQFVEACKVRVLASDGTTPIPPFGMVYIPAGPFQMGDNLNELGDDAKPVRTVNVDSFFMDKVEVSRELWTDVRAWAVGNGYSMNAGSARDAGHPIVNVNWFDAAAWCNARSEKEGLTPVYYTDDSQTVVVRGPADMGNACVKWSANGYRLPTEAEWEKAARGARLGSRYPWGDTIDASMANYYGDGNNTTPCGSYNGSQNPPGVDMANGYGLYDMAGNAWEWCWDVYGSTYYGTSESTANPRGPSSGSNRALRGGAWNSDSGGLRCAFRNSYAPGSSGYDGHDYLGFRCVRGR